MGNSSHKISSHKGSFLSTFVTFKELFWPVLIKKTI
jgi:hypothetical protein